MCIRDRGNSSTTSPLTTTSPAQPSWSQHSPPPARAISAEPSAGRPPGRSALSPLPRRRRRSSFDRAESPPYDSRGPGRVLSSHSRLRRDVAAHRTGGHRLPDLRRPRRGGGRVAGDRPVSYTHLTLPTKRI